MNTNWSNAGGNAWLHNGVQAAAGQYPGMAGSVNDIVLFQQLASGPATLDVAIGSIQTLQFTGWNDTLTLNKSLTVSGAGNFLLSDSSTISLTNGTSLSLTDLTKGATWQSGTISGGVGTNVNVTGTNMSITGTPAGLGANMVLQKSPNTGKGSTVTMASMGGNLALTGTSNIIEVGNGCKLELNQTITTNGTQNTLGGIAFGTGHTAAGNLAVQVDSGGELDRGGAYNPGIPDQISIAGAVYNEGGTVKIADGEMLNITGSDGNGYSYWQDTGVEATLQVGKGANITASGSYEIDTGKVQLTAPSGGTADELDGKGLAFGADFNTSLNLVDSTAGTPGTVTVQGPVTLAGNTTTTMNFSGGNNTADMLDVQNGTLTVAGTLSLVAGDNKKPTQPLNFFDDRGTAPAINGNFMPIKDNVGGTDTGKVVINNPQQEYYQVTIK